MKKIFLFATLCIAVLTSCGNKAQQEFAQETTEPILLFDLAHGQFQDVFLPSSYYDYVVPDYDSIATSRGIKMELNRDEITAERLKNVAALWILSPLARDNQVPFSETEKTAIIDYINGGGSVAIFVDEEERRVIIDEFGVNDILRPFGIELLDDLEVPGNCGAKTFINEIFSVQHEIPCSGVRGIKGGIPAVVCMEGGYQLGSFVKTDNGGRLFVMGETMGGLLMGLPDGDRNVHKMMETRWWGKDSYQFVSELMQWAVKK